MSYVKVDEVEQYMKVDDTGIGMIPQGEEVKLPNPATGNNGDCIVVDNGRYVLGAGSGGSGGGSGSSGILVVNAEEVDSEELDSEELVVQLDKTWQEIYDAMASSVVVVKRAYIDDCRSVFLVRNVYSDSADYVVTMDDGSTTYLCASPDDYPATNGDK